MDRHALLLVDVQRGFDDVSFWGTRNNPDLETNVAALLDHWRHERRPVVFVRHDSLSAGSPLRPGRPGNDVVLDGEPDLLVTKSVNSAFHGAPDLHAWLHDRHLDGIVVAGITTNHCCETTARVGGNLGHDVRFVLDATATFDRADPWGDVVGADELARVTAANLHGEFATVMSTAEVLSA